MHSLRQTRTSHHRFENGIGADFVPTTFWKSFPFIRKSIVPLHPSSSSLVFLHRSPLLLFSSNSFHLSSSQIGSRLCPISSLMPFDRWTIRPSMDWCTFLSLCSNKRFPPSLIVRFAQVRELLPLSAKGWKWSRLGEKVMCVCKEEGRRKRKGRINCTNLKVSFCLIRGWVFPRPKFREKRRRRVSIFTTLIQRVCRCLARCCSPLTT